MAIYTIDKTSEASILAGIKAALTAAGILTTTHYQTNSLIITTTMCPMVIRINADYARVAVYVGTSWSSGDGINGSVTIQPGTNMGTPAEVNVVVTDKILFIGERVTSNQNWNVIFGNVTGVNKSIAIGWWSGGGSNSIIYNCTDGVQCGIAALPRTIISIDGYYYSHDIITTTNGGVLLATGIDGLKAIQMPPVVTSNYQEYGNDVVVPGGDTLGITGYIGQSLLIKNGKSWAPE